MAMARHGEAPGHVCRVQRALEQRNQGGEQPASSGKREREREGLGAGLSSHRTWQALSSELGRRKGEKRWLT